MSYLRDFLDESLKIEGVTRSALLPETEAAEAFLKVPVLQIEDLTKVTLVFDRAAAIRDKRGMSFMVGNYKAPPGGKKVVAQLAECLIWANGNVDMWEVHCAFQALHPYMRGNGYAGRMLWLWQWMHKPGNTPPRSFLLMAYRQAIHAARMAGRS